MHEKIKTEKYIDYNSKSDSDYNNETESDIATSDK